MSISLPVEWWVAQWCVTYSLLEVNGDPEEKDTDDGDDFDGAGCAVAA